MQNHFTARFKNKKSVELRQIIENQGMTPDAKRVAQWILEEREHAGIQEIEDKFSFNSEEVDPKYKTGLNRFISLFIDGFVLSLFAYVLPEILQNFHAYFYSIGLHFYLGQTFGKMAMSLKVVDYETEKPLSFKQALMRDVVPLTLQFIGVVSLLVTNEFYTMQELIQITAVRYALFGLLFINGIWGLLEIATLIDDPKSRALHDKIAKTIVMRTDL